MSTTIFVNDKGDYVKGDKNSPVGTYLKKIQGLQLCDVDPKAGNLGCDLTNKECADKNGACKLFKYKLGFDGINFSITAFTALDKDYKITKGDKGWHFLCQCCEVKKLDEKGHGLRIENTGTSFAGEDVSADYPEVNTKCGLNYIAGVAAIGEIEIADPGLWLYCEELDKCDQGECELVRLEQDDTDLKPTPIPGITKSNPYKVDFEKDKGCIFVCSCSKPPLIKKPHHHKHGK